MSTALNKFCVVKNTKTGVVTRDFTQLYKVPDYEKDILIENAQDVLTRDINDERTRLALIILQLYYPYPVHYMPKIHHLKSTCWMAVSLWFIGSIRSYAMALRLSKKSNLSYIGEMMTETTPLKDRKYAMKKDWKSVERCARPGLAMRKEHDVSENFEYFFTSTEDYIKDSLFTYKDVAKEGRIHIHTIAALRTNPIYTYLSKKGDKFVFKPYIIVNLMHKSSSDGELKVHSKHKVEETIVVKDHIYTLTSACIHSSGHWTIAVKDVDSNTYFMYDDLDNTEIEEATLEDIRSGATLLCYTELHEHNWSIYENAFG